MMRAFSADYIFPISAPPIRNGVVVADGSGIIRDVLPPEKYHAENFAGKPDPERYSGIICPGFINAHCHLELSHLKGKMKAGTTLPAFIGEIINGREAEDDVIASAIEAAEREMLDNGIAGTGDICNTGDTLAQKMKKNMRYHNFIEVFDIDPSRADDVFEKGLSLFRRFKETGSTSSIVPHAPYTVSPKLLRLLNDHAYRNDSLLTLHNQETESENEMFLRGSGALFEKLSSFGGLYSNWKATGFSAEASTLVHLPRCNKTLLVHNTYTTQEDINWAHLYSPDIYWCFCPNANLYIENRLPDFQVFIDNSCRILTGTDSYASNRSLSILEELKTISEHAPKISLDTLLRWSTLNGAEFFGWKNELGSLEKGKKPGLNLITGVNTDTLSLTPSSAVKPLINA